MLTIIFNNICYFGHTICFCWSHEKRGEIFFLHVFGHSNSHLRSLMKNVEAPETKLGHLFVGFVGIVGLTVYSFRNRLNVIT